MVIRNATPPLSPARPTGTSAPVVASSLQRTTAPAALKPSTTSDAPAARFDNDGATTAAATAKIATSTGGPVKGGVLGFLLTHKSAPVLRTDAEILGKALDNASIRALLELRVNCPPQYSPHVELTRADGSVVVGAVKGVSDDGHVVVDTGFGNKLSIPLSEPLSLVRHQMDTDGDLHTALVSVFAASAHVSDPWQLAAFAGKSLSIETFGAEHATLSVAAKKGDVSASAFVVAGATPEGLALKGDGVLHKEDWQIAKVAIDQPAYSYKNDGMRLADVGTALAAGTAVDVTLPGGRSLSGTLLGVATDAEGSDYVVVQQKNGSRHALRDVVDVKAAATTRELWRHPDYTAVYG